MIDIMDKEKQAANNLFTKRTKQNMTTDKEQRTANITYTQAGVSYYVGQESGKFEV
jgi:hypothetical protein